MGYFSWDCKGCSHSLREGSPQDWMTRGVVLDPQGSRVVGDYDGYGRLGAFDITEAEKPEVWHFVCWEVSGRPEYSGPSPTARDQGLTDYDLTKPKELLDIQGLRAFKTAQLAQQRAESRLFWTSEVARLQAEGKPVPAHYLEYAKEGWGF